MAITAMRPSLRPTCINSHPLARKSREPNFEQMGAHDGESPRVMEITVACVGASRHGGHLCAATTGSRHNRNCCPRSAYSLLVSAGVPSTVGSISTASFGMSTTAPRTMVSDLPDSWTRRVPKPSLAPASMRRAATRPASSKPPCG